jgi:hypothetical protein
MSSRVSCNPEIKATIIIGVISLAGLVLCVPLLTIAEELVYLPFLIIASSAVTTACVWNISGSKKMKHLQERTEVLEEALMIDDHKKSTNFNSNF